MIGDEIAAYLPLMREQAESMMVDTCAITIAGSKVWDEDNGKWTTGEDEIYNGKCRVQSTLTNENNPNAGERNWTVQSDSLQLPMSVTGIPIGAKVTALTSEFDPDLPGRVFLVAALAHKTHMTARRYRVEEITE